VRIACRSRRCSHAFQVLFALILTGSSLSAQGPPYQTDDRGTLELQRYEFYTLHSDDGTPVERDLSGPGFELD